jgi:hypothetical protein
MNAADIQVLQREEGYLRLRLPPALRSREAGAAIEGGLASLAGVQRVTLLTAEGRLAVRFDPRSASHASVALRIKDALAALPQPEVAVEETAAPEAPTANMANMANDGDSLAARFDDVRGKLIAAAPEKFRPMVESATTEKAITNFFNDIVAFYLIKMHWDLIVNRWIKDPVKYGNAWLTVFYLVFLLVRYRKS